METQHRNFNEGDVSSDEPTYSRLFVVYDKFLKKDDLENAFSPFGEIQCIKMSLDKIGTPKGVCFIKFSRTSAAAQALENMHKKLLPNSTRALKVMVAAKRSEVERSDDDEEKYKRLFIHIPRTMTELELEEIFSKYGRLRYVTIQRDHDTGNSKGFAYVSYTKFSEAALAFEECDRDFRPVFAKPRHQKRVETSYESNIGKLASTNANSSSLMPMMSGLAPNRTGYTAVNYMCCPQLQQWQIAKLFDLIPGMVECQHMIDHQRRCGKGTVAYSNPVSASYAVGKLNEFEYPPGMVVYVKPDDSGYGAEVPEYNKIPGVTNRLRKMIEGSRHNGAPDLARLAEAIAEASQLIKKATGDASDALVPDSNDLNYCSVKLPAPKPLVHIDSAVAKRCFIVCKPAPPSQTVLRDVFCRFGDLVNVYTLPNKTVGFACYATEAGANEAIKVLHGAEVCGVRMKVLEAEEEAPPKKRRFDNEH